MIMLGTGSSVEFILGKSREDDYIIFDNMSYTNIIYLLIYNIYSC